MDKTDKQNPIFDQRYAQLKNEILPSTECLEDTLNRVLPYWHEVIEPVLKDGKQIIVAAHGNSLRALVKYLDKMSDDEIMGINIPTGVPLVYELDDDLNAIKHYFSTEYGLHHSLPFYAGGLGFLAGDHIKECSDLEIPIIAIGFMHPEGYVRQNIRDDGSLLGGEVCSTG